jgi:hypothetical protein
MAHSLDPDEFSAGGSACAFSIPKQLGASDNSELQVEYLGSRVVRPESSEAPS